MPIPTKRLVISQTDGITTQDIPIKTVKSAIFTKKNKKFGVMKFLSRRAKISKKKQTQKQRDLKKHQPFKHYRTKGSFYQFRRLETLVKNKHSQMKHWSIAMERRNNLKYSKKLNEQLKGIPILLIVRIHRKKNLPKKLLSKMHKLRLLKPWDAVIKRNTPQLRRILKDLLPFITFGNPTKELIRDLILKRGRIINPNANPNKDNRSVIKSNVIIENILGKEFGCICIEDIIHVLSTNPYGNKCKYDNYKMDIDDNDNKNNDDDEDDYVILENGEKKSKIDIFDGVANSLNPFNLNTITIPMKGLKTPFNHLGYWGFRGNYINTFVEKII